MKIHLRRHGVAEPTVQNLYVGQHVRERQALSIYLALFGRIQIEINRGRLHPAGTVVGFRRSQVFRGHYPHSLDFVLSGGHAPSNVELVGEKDLDHGRFLFNWIISNETQPPLGVAQFQLTVIGVIENVFGTPKPIVGCRIINNIAAFRRYFRKMS